MLDFDPEERGDLYAELARPRITRLLKLLKLDAVYVRAQGDVMWCREPGDAGAPRPIVDLLGGYGSTLLGHNHPEIVQATQDALTAGVAVHAQASVRSGAALVARKLNEMMERHAPADTPRRYVVTLCNSGAEAVEAALKHALMEWQERRKDRILELERRRSELPVAASGQGSGQRSPEATELERRIDELLALRPVIAAVDGSFHGKTAGSVAVTTNLEFKGMYEESPLRAVFLQKSDGWAEAEARLAAHRAGDFSALAAVLYEAIQGEGGIQPLTPDFAAVLARLSREHGAPLVADEIQCGLFRTGSFLGSSELGLAPDYVLLGKSLGGGVAKVAALLVDQRRYCDKFGFVHTSTFAEDELSSLAALRTLEVIDRDAETIRAAARAFEERVRAGVARIKDRFPGVINEVRGRGFLLGIEFNFADEAPIPTILHTIYQSGFAGYVYASYLFHRHGLRVGVTLSKPDTLRIEPSALIRDESLDAFLAGLEDLCGLLHERKLVRITSHFWGQEFSERALDAASPLRYPPVRATSDVRRVGFLCHLINDTHVKLMDPLLRWIGQEGRERFQAKFGPVTGPVLFHEQLIEGANGRAVHLHCYGVFLPSLFFEKSHRAADGLAFAQVQQMAERAARDGMEYVGLGQYTSIVSANGTLLRRLGVPMTTGNGLTAAYAFQGAVQALAETGLSLAEAKVGVVGAAGNICGVVTQLLADEARELLLVFRDGTEDGERARELTDRVLANSRLDAARITRSSKLADLRDCDLVIMGTNSAEAVLLPEHLKEGATVMDVSVPSNIDPRILTERKDVRCFQGGRARLPLEQHLRSDWLPVPPGETYACMGETLCAGLIGQESHLSYGPLTKAGVREVMSIAERVGMQMGSLRRLK